MRVQPIDTNCVVSFSYKPHDKEAYEAIAELRAYGKKRGISFSFLVLKAIKNHLRELNDESRQN